MPENDIEKLKEFMYRSSEELKYLTKTTDAIDAKVDMLIKDVLMLKMKAWIFGIAGGAIITALFQIVINYLGKG